MIKYFQRLRIFKYGFGPLCLIAFVIAFIFSLKNSSFNQDFFLYLNVTYHHPIIWQFITIFGDSFVLIAVSLPLLMRDARFRNIVFISAIVCWLLVRLGKLFFVELRPLSFFSEADFFVSGIKLYHYSFPSGHSATIATLIFCVIGYFPLRYSSVLALIGGVFLIGISRVMVGAHWPIDVVAGVAIGFFSSQLAMYFRDRFFLKNSIFAYVTGFIFISCALYAPFHNTGYPVTYWLVLICTVLAIIVSFLMFFMIENDQKRTSLLKIYFLWIFLIYIFLLLEEMIEWRKALQQWSDLSFFELIGLMILTMLSYWARAVRLQYHYLYLMKGQLFKAFWVTSWHNFTNNVFPFRTGEIAYPILLKKYFNVNYTNSVATLFLFRLMDVYAIALLGVVVYSVINFNNVLSIFLSLILFLTPILVWFLISKFSQSKFFSSLRHKFYGSEFTLRVIVISAILSLVNWLSKLLAFTILLVALGEVDWIAAFLGSLGGELSSIAPLHGVMGFGTYEAGVSVGLGLMGVSLDKALLSAVNLHIFVLLSSVASVGLAWLINRKLCP